MALMTFLVILRVPAKRSLKWFCCLGLVVFLRALASLAMGTSTDFAAFNTAAYWLWGLDFFGIGFFALTIHAMTCNSGRKPPWPIVGFNAALFILHCIIPGGLIAYDPATFQIRPYPWGETLATASTPLGFGYAALLVSLLVTIGWSVLRTLACLRAPGHGWITAGAVMVAMIVITVAVVHNVLNDLGIIPSLDLVGHSYLALCVLFSFALANEVMSAARLTGELAQSQSRLAAILESVGEGLIAADRNGRIQMMNPVAERLTGWQLHEANGLPLEEVYRIRNDESGDEHRSSILEVLETEQQAAPVKSILERPDGSFIRISETGSPIRGPENLVEGLVIVFHDITIERKLQDELRQSQKMEAIGQLASGMAHDFGNVLGGIVGFSELLRAEIEHQPRALRYLDAIDSAAENAEGYVTKLLACCRHREQDMDAVDIHDVIEEVAGLLRPGLGGAIDLVTEFTAADSLVLVDRGQMHGVLLNLAVNARDAMPSGGQLVIRTANVEHDGQETLGSGLAIVPGPYLRVDVEDTGTGIDRYIRDRIFEPFFTTKPEGKGTGLGLSMVFAAMKDHGGAVTLSSEQGEGTTFSLWLPMKSA